MLSVTALLIYLGRSQYRLFEVNDALLASNVFDTMDEAVIVTDLSFKIQKINLASEKLLATTTRQASGQDFRTFFGSDAWQKIRAQLLKLKEQGSYKIGEMSILNYQHEQLPVVVHGSTLLEDADAFAYVFVISDVSDMTRSYKQLEQLQAQLAAEKAGVEHTVEVRTKELQEAQKQLETADQLKSEFIVLTSHNLRTPLSIVSGNAELLKATPLNDQQRAYIKNLESSIKRLRDYIENLLTISAIEAGGQAQLQSVSINQVVVPLVDEVRDVAVGKNIKFAFEPTTDDQVFVKANVSRLQSAIRNILDNAIKFTSHGSVDLRVDNYDDKVVISVKDTGIGISEEEIPRLFTAFHRATSAMKYSYEGGGLGYHSSSLSSMSMVAR